MPQGLSNIPDLRLTVLQKLIERFMTPPNLLLMNLFGQETWPSDNIEWESQVGNRGMTPFVAPGAPAPMTAPVGVAKHSAMAAFWKEKIYYDEAFLNNLRKEGTTDTYLSAQRRLARDMQMLRGRCDRRKEWMFAKMLTAGSFTYKVMSETYQYVNYDVPAAQIVTLAADRKWDTGNSRNILEDVMDAKLALQNSCGAKIDYALFTSEILKLMIMDTGIQTLLTKHNYGQGDLFSNPVRVLGSLLDIPNMVLYDEQFQLRYWLTAAVTGSSTTNIYLDDTADIEVGDTLRFNDTSARTWEEETVSALVPESGYVTISTAPTASFKAGEDFVTVTKKFIPTTQFCMFASTVEGQKIAEFANAPFGVDRKFGMQVDDHEEWDPSGIFIRVQNKGLPVLYQSDGIYVLTVK